MNVTADDIYQELIALPESKLAEIQQFIDFVKFKNPVVTQPDKVAAKTPQLATRRILEIARESTSVSGQNRWTRDELYER